MDQSSTASQPKSGIPMSIIALGAVVIIAIGAIVYINQSSQKEMAKVDATAQQASPTPVAMEASGEAMEAATYKDGTYEATGAYQSPGGPEEIDVSVTIKDGVITETTATPKATLPKSIGFQNIFTSNYATMVVGKPLDTVMLDKVSGSSLTPKGFNDAINQIKAEAKS